MILGDEAVVKIIILYLQKNGFPIHIFPGLKKVHGFRRDEHTVGIYELHGNEAKKGKREKRTKGMNKCIYKLYIKYTIKSRVVSVRKKVNHCVLLSPLVQKNANFSEKK